MSSNKSRFNKYLIFVENGNKVNVYYKVVLHWTFTIVERVFKKEKDIKDIDQM